MFSVLLLRHSTITSLTHSHTRFTHSLGGSFARLLAVCDNVLIRLVSSECVFQRETFESRAAAAAKKQESHSLLPFWLMCA